MPSEWSLSWETPFIAAVCLPPACCSSPSRNKYFTHLAIWANILCLTQYLYTYIFFPKSIRSVNFRYSNIFEVHYVTPRGWRKFLVTNEGKEDFKKTTQNLEVKAVLEANAWISKWSTFFDKYVFFKNICSLKLMS